MCAKQLWKYSTLLSKRCFMTTGRTVFSFFNFSSAPAWILSIPRDILRSKRPIYLAWQLTLEPGGTVKEVLVILLMEDILQESIGNLIHYLLSGRLHTEFSVRDPRQFLLKHQQYLRRGSSISQTSHLWRWGWMSELMECWMKLVVWLHEVLVIDVFFSVMLGE